MKRDRLPDKPSELIRVAVADLEKVEHDKRYVVNMSYWHLGTRLTHIGLCKVCLAGAVLAKTLGCSAEDTVAPLFFRYTVDGELISHARSGWGQTGASASDDAKLVALDRFRCGEVLEGLGVLGIAAPIALKYDVYGYAYEDGPEEFKGNMLRLAANFEEVGL